MVQSWKDRDIWPARQLVLSDGSQTLVDEEEPHTHLKLTQGQIRKNKSRKIVKIFLSISFNKCFGCLKEPSH